MRGLASRLKRLEKRCASTGAAPVCGVCAGMGTIDIVIDGEPDDPNRRRGRGCPECGRVFTIFYVVSDDGSTADDPSPQRSESGDALSRPPRSRGNATY